MNPDEIAARAAIMQRMAGNPQPQLSQIGPGAGVQTAPPVQQPQIPQPQQNIGQQTRKASPTEKLVKSMLPATSNVYDPAVQGMSKTLLTQLIKYL